MTSKKHAFLIIMHNPNNNVQKIIDLYDNENFCFFIHVDKKFKEFDFSFKSKKSEIIYLSRKSLIWGTYSIVDCELRLIEKALNYDDFSYFHLISGDDFPLHDVNIFLKFFSEKKCSYIGFNDLHESFTSDQKENRTKYFYFFNKFINKNKKGKMIPILYKLQGGTIKLQNFLKVNRNKDKIIYSGSQWFSLYRDAAFYLIENKKNIKKDFMYTECPDELFVQTFIMKKENIFLVEKNNLRLIDWKKGTPYSRTINDFKEIKDKSEGCFFVRKVRDNLLSNKMEEIIESEKICL